MHPVQDEGVMAGNGTIGLEILDDLPDPDAVVIPFGGGGLTVGIASAIKAQAAADEDLHGRAGDRGGAGGGASQAAGPADVEYEPSFVDGSGSRRVLDPMWPRLEDARRRRVRGADRRRPPPRSGRSPSASRVIAEGAGALATAAALAGAAGAGKVVCIVSGGNINLATLAEILRG